jgi:hypothetical protein
VQTNISGTGLVNFLFDNILLPDSNANEPASHGFVTYKVNLKPSLTVGTVINNYASIYFDYNAPVITNTTITTLSTTALGVNELSGSETKIYPNPTKGVFTIENSDLNIQKIKIINVLGQTIMEERHNGNEKYIIDLSSQTKGVYFVELISNSSTSIIKKLILE